ncbi:MAG: hypothetical protein ACPG8H_05920, partial [Candidatus Thalassarchaeaceae archaeon]
DMEGFSEYEENNTKPSKKEIMEDVSELEAEYRMLHTKHTIDEINKMYNRDKIKSKNSKFFFGAAIFFYLMIFWIPMLSRVYFIAGTICLFLQYLVSIGKVEISQVHDDNSGSSSDFDHP